MHLRGPSRAHPNPKRSPTRSGTKAGFESAAFPNGLPLHALETSVAPEGFSSDSDKGNVYVCQCKDTKSCRCSQPRASGSSSKPRKHSVKFELNDRAPMSVFGDPSRVQSNTAQILARIAELRPVLPRPADASSSSMSPSPSPHHNHHGGRHYHENTFSPYERAYGMSHHQPLHPHASSNAFSNPTAPHMPPPPPHGSNGIYNNLPSVCGCGDNCQCPGCSYHNNTILSAESAFSTCANPDNCTTCLDCTILSLQNMMPPDTALSIPEPSADSAVVDEWLRQLVAPPQTPHHNSEYAGYTGSSPTSSMWAAAVGGSSDGYVPSLEFDFNNAVYDPSPMGYQGNSDGDYTRSRSVSTSSQASHPEERSMSAGMPVQVPYRPSGRIQGLFENAMGSRSAPQLNIPGMYRGSGGGGGGGGVSPVQYASSNPESHDCYDPSLDSLHIH